MLLVVLDYPFFQNCDSNIELSSIVSIEVIALNIICYIFGIRSSLICSLFIVIVLAIIVALRGDNNKFYFSYNLAIVYKVNHQESNNYTEKNTEKMTYNQECNEMS